MSEADLVNINNENDNGNAPLSTQRSEIEAYVASEIIIDNNVIIEKVTGLIINDVNQALTRYKAGELDKVEPLPPGQFPALKEEMPDQATSVPRLCSYYYTFNHREEGQEALAVVW